MRVLARVRREVLDMFCRVHAQHLAGPPPAGGRDGPGWAEVELRFRAVKAARPLLAFGADVRVVSPAEVRADLAAIAAAAVACHGEETPG